MAHQVVMDWGPYHCRACLRKDEVSTQDLEIRDGDYACDDTIGIVHTGCCTRCHTAIEAIKARFYG